MTKSTVYDKTVKGKLVFKGDDKKKHKKKKKIRSSEQSHLDKSEEVQYELKESNGTGRITSSGTTVHGLETEFAKELSVGDALIITHPTTLQDETKIVRMVLSNISISISSPFSTDLITSTPFRYIKAPKEEEDSTEKEKKELEKQHQIEESAFGTYASKGGQKLVYRVKKESAYGGYKIITQDLGGSKSREDLLDMRVKKKSDRFCY